MVEKRRKLDEVLTELEDAGVKGLGEAPREKGQKHRDKSGSHNSPPKKANDTSSPMSGESSNSDAGLSGCEGDGKKKKSLKPKV